MPHPSTSVSLSVGLPATFCFFLSSVSTAWGGTGGSKPQFVGETKSAPSTQINTQFDMTAGMGSPEQRALEVSEVLYSSFPSVLISLVTGYEAAPDFEITASPTHIFMRASEQVFEMPFPKHLESLNQEQLVAVKEDQKQQTEALTFLGEIQLSPMKKSPHLHPLKEEFYDKSDRFAQLESHEVQSDVYYGVTHSGQVYRWGVPSHGLLGLDVSGVSDSPQLIQCLENKEIKYLDLKSSGAVILATETEVFATGEQIIEELQEQKRQGFRATAIPLEEGFVQLPIPKGVQIKSIHSARACYFAPYILGRGTVEFSLYLLSSDGKLFVWGDHTHSYLGLKSSGHLSSFVPVPFPQKTRILAITSSFDEDLVDATPCILALSEQGEVYLWDWHPYFPVLVGVSYYRVPKPLDLQNSMQVSGMTFQRHLIAVSEDRRTLYLLKEIKGSKEKKEWEVFWKVPAGSGSIAALQKTPKRVRSHWQFVWTLHTGEIYLCFLQVFYRQGPRNSPEWIRFISKVPNTNKGVK